MYDSVLVSGGEFGVTEFTPDNTNPQEELSFFYTGFSRKKSSAELSGVVHTDMKSALGELCVKYPLCDLCSLTRIVAFDWSRAVGSVGLFGLVLIQLLFGS